MGNLVLFLSNQSQQTLKPFPTRENPEIQFAKNLHWRFFLWRAGDLVPDGRVWLKPSAAESFAGKMPYILIGTEPIRQNVNFGKKLDESYLCSLLTSLGT
jgi:hypothetical protein